MATVERALYALPLAAGPDAIAARLVELGHRGEPCQAGACPIVRYIRAETGLAADACDAFVLTDEGTTRVPAPVSVFIQRFDRGAYPDLIAVEVSP